MNMIKYRIYADDTVVHEDDFHELDEATPYYDDYLLVEIPEVLENHIFALGAG